MKNRIQYRFDNLMSKGTIALVGVLFIATAIVITIVGLLLLLLDKNGAPLSENIWLSIMHVIDAGTITGAETNDVIFLILMSIATLCGIFVTSILISIITAGFEEKLSSLKKGNSQVIEENHTVILGFNNDIYTLISEIVTANENQKDGCIVVLSSEEKEVVENAIAQEIKNMKTTRVICRTGSISDIHMLQKCAVDKAKVIIVNEPDDLMTLKGFIAVNNFLESNIVGEKKPYVVSTINSKANYDAIQIVSNGNAELILIEDAISRIIAQACRQPGISNVLIELFDYDGDELYFERIPDLVGKTMEEAINSFSKSIVFGYSRDGEIYLNPKKSIRLEKDDEIILLAEDDGVSIPTEHKVRDVSKIRSFEEYAPKKESILIIDMNHMIEKIINELGNYFTEGSEIIVAHSYIDKDFEEKCKTIKGIDIQLIACDTSDRATLEELTSKDMSHVLLLSDRDLDDDTSDATTLLQLIHLRDIAKSTGKKFNITSELKDVSNQKLAEVAKVNDLVIGSNIVNLVMTQISENRSLSKVFSELLYSIGNEIYIRKASYFVKPGIEMDFYQVSTILCEHDQIAIGYKVQVKDGYEIVMNPTKSDKIIFGEEDYIISLADK